MPLDRKGREPYEGPKDYIFISYAHKDNDTIFPILRRMKEEGFRFWYDDGIEPGSEWPESIARHLADSKACMAFLSTASAKSRNCRREINYALAKEKDFLSVVLEHVDLTPGLEMQISTYQSIVYTNHQDPDDVVRRLLQMDNLKSCRQIPEAAVKPVGLDWVENPIPMPKAEIPEDDNSGTEILNRDKEPSGKTILQEEVTEAEEKPEAEIEEKKKEKEEKKRTKKEKKNTEKQQKKSGGSEDGETSEEKPRKKKGRKKLLLLIPLILAVLVLAFAGRKLFHRKLKIGDKTYVNTTSYQNIKDAELTAANLKTLSKFSECRTLILENCSLPEGNMEILARMKELRDLEIRDCTGVENLTPLAMLPELHSLKIIGCSLEDSQLEDFTGNGEIRYLDFSFNLLKKIPLLAGAENVMRMNLGKNSLEDTEKLSAYTSLVELDLSANNLTALEGITLPEQLERFLAADNQLASVEVLTECIRLKSLDISGNQVEDLSGLKNMTLLENVSLAGNSALTDLSFLRKNAATMKRLNVSGISLSENEEALDAIISCSSLRALGMSDCGLTRTDFLENLKDLCWLDLSDNAIEKLEGIFSHKSLTFLNLTNNALTDMTGLPVVEEPDYPGIFWLLHGNRISELYDNMCGDINLLDISGNPVTDFGPYRKKTVKNIIFEVNEDTDLTSVKSEETYRTYYVIALPADRKVEFEDTVSRSGVFVTWEEALAKTAGNMLAFTFDR